MADLGPAAPTFSLEPAPAADPAPEAIPSGGIELSPSIDLPMPPVENPAPAPSQDDSGGISLSLGAPDSLELEPRNDVASTAAPAPEISPAAINFDTGIALGAPEQAPEPAFAVPDLSPSAPATASVPEDDTSTTRIKPGTRKRAALAELARWNLPQLKNNADPLAKALVALFDQGVQSALYLPMHAPDPGQKVPIFVSSSMIGSPFKERVWRGLRWDPRVVPQLWNVFLRTGLVELTPPGHNTVATSNRNVVRAAFGVSLEEYLILVRVGPLNATRGILALVSIESKVREVEAQKALLETPLNKAA